MQVSVEISLYPLREEFVPPIGDFIDRLRQYPDIRVNTNAMSTQIFGDYQQVLGILAREMEQTHSEVSKAVFVMKVLGGDVSSVPPAED